MIIIITLLQIVYGEGNKDSWLFQSKNKWDEQWKAGQWSYMDTVPVERSKIAIVGVLANMYVNSSSNTITNTTPIPVLDVGCGEGSFADFLPNQMQQGYVGIDISKQAIDKARLKRPNLKFINSGVHQFIPHHNRKFNLISFADMLYYVDHKNVMKQFNDYLKDDGVVIICIFYNYRIRTSN